MQEDHMPWASFHEVVTETFCAPSKHCLLHQSEDAQELFLLENGRAKESWENTTKTENPDFQQGLLRVMALLP